MSVQPQTNQPQTPPAVTENKPNDKEFNFRMQEAKYEKQLAQERAARIEAERIAQEATSRRNSSDDEEDSEPYVDHKKLDKKLAKFGEKNKQETQSEIQRAVQDALQKERQANWMKQNPDFYDVMNHANKLLEKDPELSESILDMPDGFERQKLVYKTIKNMGLHKPEVKQPSIQDKVDANRRSPYYQPSNQGSPAYASEGNFSPQGQKDAYTKMQELKNKLRI